MRLFTLQPMKRKHLTSTVALSAQLVELGESAPTEIRLLPDGTFRSSRDERPTDVPAWIMDGECAQAILSAQAALSSKFLIDYDHATLHADKNGKPASAPAAGWGARLEWRSGDGLYATAIEWTASALSAIASKEYRYISPVIRYDDQSGKITGVLMAALTNYPAIDNLNDLAAAAALLFNPEQQDNPMEKLIAPLCALLGLPDTATTEDIGTALDALKPLVTQLGGSTVSLAAALQQQTDKITALSGQFATAATPDPSKYVPVAVVTELRDKLAALSGNTQSMQVSQLIEQGVSDGRIIGDAMKTWLTDMGTKNIADLQGYLDNAQPIAALSGMQTGGKPPAGIDAAASSEDKARQQYQASAALQAEFGDEATYLAYLGGVASGGVKILGDKK